MNKVEEVPIQVHLLEYEFPILNKMEVELEIGFVQGSYHEEFESNDGGHENMEEGDGYEGGFI